MSWWFREFLYCNPKIGVQNKSGIHTSVSNSISSERKTGGSLKLVGFQDSQVLVNMS